MAQWRIIDQRWNGLFGRLARRDLRLSTNGTTWRVEARQGTADNNPWWTRDYRTEDEARKVYEGLIKRGAPLDQWRNITDVVTGGLVNPNRDQAARSVPAPDARQPGPPRRPEMPA